MALYVWGCNTSQQLGLDSSAKELYDLVLYILLLLLLSL